MNGQNPLGIFNNTNSKIKKTYHSHMFFGNAPPLAHFKGVGNIPLAIKSKIA